MADLQYLPVDHRNQTHYFVHLAVFTGVSRFGTLPVTFLYHGERFLLEQEILAAFSKVFKDQMNQNIGRFIVVGEAPELSDLLVEVYDYNPRKHPRRLHLCASGDKVYEVKMAVLITDGDVVYQLMLDSFATPVFAQIHGERVT